MVVGIKENDISKYSLLLKSGEFKFPNFSDQLNQIVQIWIVFEKFRDAVEMVDTHEVIGYRDGFIFRFHLKDFFWTKVEEKSELFVAVVGSEVGRDQQLDEEGRIPGQKLFLIFIAQGTKITENKKYKSYSTLRQK